MVFRPTGDMIEDQDWLNGFEEICNTSHFLYISQITCGVICAGNRTGHTPASISNYQRQALEQGT